MLSTTLSPGYDRYLPYHILIQETPDPAYVFLSGSPQASEIVPWMRAHDISYRLYRVKDYLVYQVT